MSASLFETLKEGGKLPTPPGVVLRVLELTRQPDVAVSEIAETLGQDPVLAAKVLRFANSPIAGVPREVTSLQHAVALMGTRGAKMTALSFAVLGSGGTNGCKGFDHHQYAVQSIGCGVAAKLLAEEAGSVDDQEAFLAGLLSQIGRAVLAVGMPEEYAGVLEKVTYVPCDLPVLESIIIGDTYASVSAQLLRSWNIPETLCTAIESFHSIQESTKPPDLARVLYVAETAAGYLCPTSKSSCPDAQRFVEAAHRVLGIENDRCADLLTHIATEIRITRDVLEMSKGHSRTPEDIQNEVRERIAELSMAIQIENRSIVEQQEELVRRATTDALTGVGNRVAFDSRMSLELERASRYQSPIGLLMIDVDRFKSVNDTYGHQAGDLVLRNVARTIADNIRKVDFLARYGGEEFAVIAPDTPARGVAVLAIRLREAVEQSIVEWQEQELHVTISIGAAVFTQSVTPDCGARIISAADKQLYAAKHAGRNCVKMVQGETLEEEKQTA